MLLDARKSMAASGRQPTRVTIAAQSILVASGQSGLLLGAALGVILATVLRYDDAFLILIARCR